ncbi:MDR family MFS transporter [Nocardia sp. NPDC004151]|uniref:MDR family MFS transporter n=1 Tax=Nocardia sp. NPDC004151 TaxID=3364304 RepID=UPI0036845737
MTVVVKFRSFDLPARLLMINQFGINLGFYMLMPYLAGYLAGPLGLAAWAVGLVLGVRNFSQQGMFLLGGTLADRLGYKPLIVAGCFLRTGGFALLVFVTSLPGLLIASAATGFAGALFNPAVRAYLAADTGERRVEAFAVFNVFYQAGILAGPLVGLALMALDFRLTAGSAAVVFAALTVAQLFALPARRAETAANKTSVLQDWRTVAANRRFVAFAAAMIGSYVLSFQVYLALPLQAEYIDRAWAQAITSAVFVITGVIAVVSQLHITAWLRTRWRTGRSLVIGMSLLSASFLPLVIVPEPQRFGTTVAIAALLAAAALLAIGTAAVFPFEMDTVVSLANGRLVATHYGFYSTVVGVGILIGNLGTGAVVGAARDSGADWAIWVGLTAIGALSTLALHRLDRSRPTQAATVGIDQPKTTISGGQHQFSTAEQAPPGTRRAAPKATPLPADRPDRSQLGRGARRRGLPT